MAEQTPNPESRVRLGGRRDRLGVPSTVLDWRLGTTTGRSIRRTVEILGDCVRDAGLGQIVSTLDRHWPPPAVFGNWHHLGTTRMHQTRPMAWWTRTAGSMASRTCTSAGGSVLPTGGYANPTLTIAALALRLADHLRARS